MKVLGRNEILRTFIKKDNPIIFDIGANNGLSSKDFRCLFPNSILHIFEPNPDCLDSLKQNFKDPLAIINNLAVSNKSEKKLLFINSNNETSSLYELDLNGFYSNKGIKNKDNIFVEAITLDNYIKKVEISYVDFLKIDTQGHSFEVLDGAIESIKAGLFNLVQVEIITGDCYKKKDDLLKIIKIMNDFDYELFTIINADTEQIGHINYDYESGKTLFFDVMFINKNFKE